MCILQGPVAAKWSLVKDDPVKDLLGNINKTLIKRLLERKYGGNESAVPTVDYLAVAPQAAASLPASVIRTESASAVTYHFGKTLPETSAWLETLGGDKLNWIRALVTSNIIVQGTSYIDNPLRRILAPRAGQKIVVKHSGSTPTSITVYGAARSYGDHIQGFKALEIIYKKTTQGIDVTLFEERQGSSIQLCQRSARTRRTTSRLSMRVSLMCARCAGHVIYFTLLHLFQVDSTGVQVDWWSPPGLHLECT